jgi:WXG100 family type VII secretion target
MAPTVVNAAAVNSLANQMDELSHRAQDVLSRYEEAIQAGQNGTFQGAAGLANISTGAQVKEAQMKIQTRFQSVNDLLRSGASTYSNTDADNQSQLHNVAGGLKFT